MIIKKSECENCIAFAGKRKGGIAVKKRIFSLFCAFALGLGLLVFSLSAGAANEPRFMAVNDNLLLLEERFIPIAVDGQYYVPYTALDSSVTGLELGIYPVYNAARGTLTIYNQTQELVFNLNSGTCTDRSGASRNARAVNRNGRIYVPARFICEYFGLTYSSKSTSYGPLVRIRSASSKLDDSTFIERAKSGMAERLREWRRTQAAADPPVSTSTPTPAPSPTPSPPPVEPDTDKSGVHTYLAFRADQTDGLDKVLTALEQAQISALFFFPAAELADYDGAVRSVLCGGHAVGLLISGATAEEAAAQAAEGNRLLAGIAHLQTNTVLTSDVEDDAVLEEIEAAGFLCWRTDVNALSGGYSVSYQASAALESIGLYSYEVYILSDASADGAVLTERLLPALIQDRYDLRLAVETELLK